MKKRVMIVLTEEIIKKLKRYSKKNDLSMSKVVRVAIEKLIGEPKNELNGN